MGSGVLVTFDGVPGIPHAWRSLAYEGSADTSDVAWIYTGGATTGTRTLAIPLAGRFVARAYADDGFTKIAETAAFDVVP